MSSCMENEPVVVNTGISSLFVYIYLEEDTLYNELLDYYQNNVMNLVEKDFETFEAGLNNVEWNRITSKSRCNGLKNFIIDLISVYPNFGVAVVTSLFTSFCNGSSSFVEMNATTKNDTTFYSLVNQYRLEIIKTIMESNNCVKSAFKSILSSSNWNRYQETHILLACISNFLFLYDSLDMNHRYTTHYKELIVSSIFSILSSIDCELDYSYIVEKKSFMTALRQKNISLKVVINHKKHDLTTDQVEQIEFYDKLDILFKYVVHFFDQMLHKTPSKWTSFIKLITKVFDTIIVDSHNTIAVQFFWFYFTAKNRKFMCAFLKHVWSQIFSPTQKSNVKRHVYINYLSGFLSHSTNVSFQMYTNYLAKINTYLCQYQDDYIRKRIENISNQSTNGSNAVNHSNCTTYTNYTSWRTYDDVEITRFLQHQLYYSLFQGMTTILVYRIAHLSQGDNITQNDVLEKLIHFIKTSLSLKEIIFFQTLNPFYYCDPIIAENLARLTFTYKILYCYNIVYKNSRRWLLSPNSHNLISMFLQTRCDNFNKVSKYFKFPRDSSIVCPLFYNPFLSVVLPFSFHLLNIFHIEWKQIPEPKSSLDEYRQNINKTNLKHLNGCSGDNNCTMFCAIIRSNNPDYNDISDDDSPNSHPSDHLRRLVNATIHIN